MPTANSKLRLKSARPLVLALALLSSKAWANPPSETISQVPSAESNNDSVPSAEDEIAKVTLARYKAYVAKAEASANKPQLWSALMSLAWYLHETGHNREAIEYSNRALTTASELNNPFMIGRSLDWLGWSYSGLGLYQLAEQFYQNGVDVGAPNGKVVHVAVWGLAAQELGALHFKMGKVDQAKAEIEATTNFARTNNISVGVAEGGAHLAEIALFQGRVSDAELLAREALKAAFDCSCSPFNTARARVILAKAVWEQAKGDPAKEEAAKLLIDEAIEKNSATGIKTMAAEAKLLKAQTVPISHFHQRYDLVREAFESLETLENDRRGSAEALLGKVFLENDQAELAETYLKHGYKVNREMFRQTESAYVLGDLATIRGLKNDRQRMYKDLKAAAERSEKMGQLPTLLETNTRIANELLADGYDSLSLVWSKKGLDVARKLAAAEPNPEAKERHQRAESALMEQISALEIRLSPSVRAEPEAKTGPAGLDSTASAE